MSRPSPHPRALAGGARRGRGAAARRRRRGVDLAAAALALLHRRLRLPRRARGRARRRQPGRPGRRGGGRRRDRPAGRGARRRLQRRRARPIGPGIVVDCFKLDRILDIDAGRPPAPGSQPGVVQAALNAAAAPHGLEFGPDTSTVDQATIGGMVGNNSSGSRSIVYGESKDKVLQRRAACSPAARRPTFGACAGDDLRSRLAGRRRRGSRRRSRSARAVPRARSPPDYPQTRRCTSGYDLRELLEPRPNLGRLLAGSEGTLALFTELEVLLDPRPAAAGGRGAHLRRRCARRSRPTCSSWRPGPPRSSSSTSCRCGAAPNLAHVPAHGALLDGDGRGHAHRRVPGLARRRPAPASRGCARSPASSAPRSVAWLEEPEALAEAAALRRAVMPLLMGAPGRGAPGGVRRGHRRRARAPRRLRRRPARRSSPPHGARGRFTGHASAGCLHLRPMLDLKTAAGVAQHGGSWPPRWRASSRSTTARSPGSTACGRSRSWSLPQLLGPGLYEAMVAVKDAFDPRPAAHPRHRGRRARVARVPALRRRLPRRRRLGAAPLLRRRGRVRRRPSSAASAPACARSPPAPCARRRRRPGTRRAPRGRAPTRCRAWCAARSRSAAIAAEEFREVLGTCVACKACKTECPAGVDMAALKVEWLAELRAREGVPPLARGVGDFRRLAALAAPFAPLVNAARRHPGGARAVTGRAGVARARPLPAFARRPLTRRLAAAAAPAAAAAGGRAPPSSSTASSSTRSRTSARRSRGCCRRRRAASPRRTPAAAAARRCPPGRSTRRARWRGARSTGCTRSPPAAPSSCSSSRRCLSMVARRLAAAAARRPARRRGRRGGTAGARASWPTWPREGRLHFRAGGRALLHATATRRRWASPPPPSAPWRPCPASRSTPWTPAAAACPASSATRPSTTSSASPWPSAPCCPAVRAAAPGTAVLATGTSCRAQIARPRRPRRRAPARVPRRPPRL